MIDKTIRQIIAMENIDRFTVLEIRTSYLVLQGDSSLNKETAWKLVYKELSKLEVLGWLTKTSSEKCSLIRFSKTPSFNTRLITAMSKHQELPFVEINDDSSRKQNLKNELKNLNVQLLKGIGSLEMYYDLYQSYPELEHLLRNKFLIAQEQNYILEGKISAVEELLFIFEEEQTL